MAARSKKSFPFRGRKLHSIISVLPNGGTRTHRMPSTGGRLHSIISVLPNGGTVAGTPTSAPMLHSIISVLPNGGTNLRDAD